MNKKILQSVILLLAALGIFAFFQYELGQYLTLDFLKDNQQRFVNYYLQNQIQTLGIFAGIYITVTALSLPGAAILTLAAGALFGLFVGTILVSFASTIGATLAFLAARFLLRDSIQAKFGHRLKAINQGIEREGAFYLFTIRLIPAFPFFVVNLVMGLTPIKTFTFFFVSQIGMLLGTIVYVNAGTELAKIESLSGIASPRLIGSFILLGILPLIAKKIIGMIKANKVYRNYRKPKSFDYNLVAIGAGSAGLVSVYIGAAVKAKVALIEKHKMGGDCLNTGCVPSKALIRSAKVVHYGERAKEFGLESIDVKFNFANVMERIQNVIAKVEPHDSVERYEGLGVDCIEGTAKILSPWEIEVNGKTITTKNIVIATGARPFVPLIKGLEKINFLTSDTLWDIREQPKNLLVIGGGPIGCEMAQSFRRLRSQVTLVQRGAQLMSGEDADVAEIIHERFRKEGVDLRLQHEIVEFDKRGDLSIAILKGPEGNSEVIFDQVILAIGRKANVTGFGLEELGISLRDNGTIETNEYLQTKYPNIFACGDVTGPYQLTHTASHQAWFCAVNALFGRFKKFKVDYSVIPWSTYTDPEVATVGLNEKTAKQQGIPYDVTTYGIDDLDRAIADNEDHGLVKVLTVPGKDRVLGCTIVGNHASDIIVEYIAAMKHGFGLNKILGTIHIYPTMGEANKYLAGNWKRANAPQGVLQWVKKFHGWERR